MGINCMSCLSGWYKEKENKVKCTNPKAPDYKRLCDNYNVCDFYKSSHSNEKQASNPEFVKWVKSLE